MLMPGDIVICAGKGWDPEYTDALCYIDKRGWMKDLGRYGVTEILSPKTFGSAGANPDNIRTVLGHIKELENEPSIIAAA